LKRSNVVVLKQTKKHEAEKAAVADDLAEIVQELGIIARYVPIAAGHRRK
jgi:hypothetical protein